MADKQVKLEIFLTEEKEKEERVEKVLIEVMLKDIETHRLDEGRIIANVTREYADNLRAYLDQMNIATVLHEE